MGKKVVITFGKDGSVRSEAFGFKGESCKEATAFLDPLFGEGKETLKPSYHETEEEKNNLVDGLPSGNCG
jgi:hypothetical protein